MKAVVYEEYGGPITVRNLPDPRPRVDGVAIGVKANGICPPFKVGCGRCPQCQTADEHLCDALYTPGFGGACSFAEFCAIPHADTNLVRLPGFGGFLACWFLSTGEISWS